MAAKDTEQEADSYDEPNDTYNNAEYLLGRNNVSKWRKANPSKNVRTRHQNIVTYLPGVKRTAKLDKTSKE